VNASTDGFSAYRPAFGYAGCRPRVCVADIKLVLIGGSPDLCAPDTLLSAEKSKPAGCLILRLKRTSLCASELLGLPQNRRRVHGLALGQT
jgi:hypothetical protein